MFRQLQFVSQVVSLPLCACVWGACRVTVAIAVCVCELGFFMRHVRISFIIIWLGYLGTYHVYATYNSAERALIFLICFQFGSPFPPFRLLLWLLFTVFFVLFFCFSFFFWFEGMDTLQFVIFFALLKKKNICLPFMYILLFSSRFFFFCLCLALLGIRFLFLLHAVRFITTFTHLHTHSHSFTDSHTHTHSRA